MCFLGGFCGRVGQPPQRLSHVSLMASLNVCSSSVISSSDAPA